MKKILLLCLIAMLNLEVQALQEKNISIHTNILKQTITCKNGTQSYILKKGNLFYSDSNKRYHTQYSAIKESCKLKYLYTKKNAIVCDNKKDIKRYFKHKTHPSMYKSCLRVTQNIPLNILNHYPLGSKESYYQAQNKDKIFYIDSTSTYTKRSMASHKKRKIYKKRKSHKKKKYKHTQKNKKHYKKHKRKITHHHKQQSIKSSSKYQDNIKYIATPEHNIIANEQYYTYKCVAIHGNEIVYATHDTSMSLASDSVWTRCQSEKIPEEVCKITDCYKLIK